MATDRYDLQLITPQTKLIFEGNNLIGIQNPRAKGTDLIPSQSAGGSFATVSGDPMDNDDLAAALNAKQATLVSATNIKTVNGTSILGSGDLSVAGVNASLSAAQLASALAGATLTAGVLYSPNDVNPRKLYWARATDSLLELSNPILDATTVENMSGAEPLAIRQARKYITAVEVDLWSSTYPITAAAGTYTTITATNNGGKVQLSSAGASGLSATGSPYLPVYCSGDATKNGLYKITGVSGSGPYLVQLDMNWSGSLGTVTVGTTATEIAVRNVLGQGGLLGIFGRYALKPSLSFSGSGTKTLRYYLGSTYSNFTRSGGTMLAKGEWTSGSTGSDEGAIHNDGSQSIQFGVHLNSSGTVTETTATEDTALSKNLTLTLQIGTAGERVRLAHLIEAIYGG